MSSTESVIGKSPISFSFCPNLNCSSQFATWTPNSKYDWAINVACDCCNENRKWYICTTCDRQRTCILTEKQLITHYRARHHVVKNKRVKRSKVTHQHDSDMELCIHEETIPTVDTSINLDFLDRNDIFIEGELLQPNQTIVNDTSTFDNVNSTFMTEGTAVTLLESNLMKYFETTTVQYFKNHCFNDSGLAYLAKLCMNNNESNESITDDSKLHFNLANLCFNISKGNRVLLRSVLDEISNNKSCSSVALVQNSCNLRKQYIDGK